MAEEWLQDKLGPSGRRWYIRDVVCHHLELLVFVVVDKNPEASLLDRLSDLESKPHALVLGVNWKLDRIFLRNKPVKLGDHEKSFLAEQRQQEKFRRLHQDVD